MLSGCVTARSIRLFSGIEYGVGVRVLAGDQTGYAYVENTSLEDMLKAARTAARIASGAPSGFSAEFAMKVPTRNYYAVQTVLGRCHAQNNGFRMCKSSTTVFFALDPRVNKVMVNLSDSSSHIFFVNSEGVMYCDYRPMISLTANCVMLENEIYENGRAARSFRMGFEFLTDDVVEGNCERSGRRNHPLMYQAIKPKGGEMPVVLGAGGSGIFLHEAIGHAFEADFNRKGTSIFSDMLHKKICGDFINVVDDGTIPFNRGSLNMDDEGVEGQKTYIVREGILTSYLHDRVSAQTFQHRVHG